MAPEAQEAGEKGDSHRAMRLLDVTLRHTEACCSPVPGIPSTVGSSQAAPLPGHSSPDPCPLTLPILAPE